MVDPFAQSPFSSAVNRELRRLLESSWKGDGYLMIPKTAGTFQTPDRDSDRQVAFYDPTAMTTDRLAVLPFPIRYLQAACRGMQSDFVHDGLEVHQAETEFLSANLRPWITFFGTGSGDQFGMPIDAAGDDPDISQLMIGEGTSSAWKLSEFLAGLTVA